MSILLETNRLILREFIFSDAEKMYALNKNPDVIKYTGDPPFASLKEARLFLENYSEYKKHGFGRWAVTTKSNDQFIGWCGLKLHEGNWVDIGFRFFQNEWGKGYATESAKACIDYGFKTLKLNEIVGRASKDNVASIKVLEKLQMQFWKIDDCNGIPNSVYYKILKDYYISKRERTDDI